ncbi:MAG: protein-methionine-sulfoxide reductase catalytic subunit MsrP [Pseudomonadota bacterium]|nr:protein-methionine-sulfoxide reductase catalytic subunit MsrP [Pseudomonadota bacterium]
MRVRKISDAKESDVVSKKLFLERRELISAAAAFGSISLLPSIPTFAKSTSTHSKLKTIKTSYGANLSITAKQAVISHNNFYEFGSDKSDPIKNSHTLKTQPWTVEVAGHVKNVGVFDYTELIKNSQLEERIYRLRCVEAWSMVVPWVGVPLAKVIQRLEPTSKAKYVAFQTLLDPEQMPFQKFSTLDWPYVEGLRIDEAVNPLALLAVGVFGEALPNQNGAPIRLVVPWKYGFKSIKSIVKITFVDKQPKTTWSSQAPREYGFFSNVNPKVDHPRWSQEFERPITGEGGFSALFARKIPTLMFNGYGEEVAHLYKDMDLNKFY